MAVKFVIDRQFRLYFPIRHGPLLVIYRLVLLTPDPTPNAGIKAQSRPASALELDIN